MNKARRHELKMLKYKQRLKKYRIKDDSKGKFFSFRSHGKPCSCYACQQVEEKYNRAKEKRNIPKQIEFELNYDMGEMYWDHQDGMYKMCA